MFSNIMARVQTWRRRNLNVSGILLKILNGTQYSCRQYPQCFTCTPS